VADGLPNRVGRIRGFGNAIVPQLAATFIRAFLEAEEEG
jgi:DNA (cytosine-5)-methyltransferase 1